MSWSFAALMPHPPVIVPEVGRGREREAALTLDGAKKLRDNVAAINRENAPDVILLLSPHLPYIPGALFVNSAPRISGSLSNFGAPSVRVDCLTERKALEEFATALEKAGIKAAYGEVADITEDHGSIVPLSILADTFPGGLPPLVMAGPSGMGTDDALKLGEALRGLSDNFRWALLASGDLSHRLKPGAPGGYSPDGRIFDKSVIEALESGSPAPLLALSQSVRENAGECGLRPVLTMLALCRAPVRVFSYEGPFGVGYCNALWSGDAARGKSADAERGTSAPGSISITLKAPKAGAAQKAAGHPYARLARLAVKKVLGGERSVSDKDIAAISADQTIWNVHKGCFVSIKNQDGSLRGCIGTFLPTQADLKAEIIANAVSASTRDPRFAPMRPEELDQARISVDVLEAPEEVREGMELDPARWGVIVSKGGRRGLLLPDLPGVSSVAQQLSIAAGKAGISDLEGARIERFLVSRYFED